MSDDINSGKSTEKAQSQDDRNQATFTMASPDAAVRGVPASIGRYRILRLLGQGAESEPLMTEGYQGIEARKDRIAAPDRYQAQMDRERVVKMYEAWGKPEKAQQWAKK